MQRRGKLGVIILIALITAAITYAFLPRPLRVETAPVKFDAMRVTIDEEGKTRVADRFVLSAPVAGFARRIALDVGDPVLKGELITVLEPLRSRALDPRSRAEAEARVAAAGAALRAARENARAAKAGADFAEKELTRVRALFSEGLAAGERLDSAEREYLRTAAVLRSSEFAVEVALYEREAALTALKYSAGPGPEAYDENVNITAPVTGVVLKVLHESEGVVREGEPLVEMGDPRALEVEVDVLSADAVRIIPGTPVEFVRWGGSDPLTGKVRIVEPAGFTKVSALGVEEQRVLVIADIVSSPEAWPRLGDGYRVEARFILWEDDRVLQVPASALFRYREGWAVFVVQNSRALLRQVTFGHRNGLAAQVLDGLGEGELVITHPDSAIEDGSRVQVISTQERST